VRCCIKSSRTDRPKLIILFGPTGVGKTDILDRLFSDRTRLKAVDGSLPCVEVISADALQIYRDLDIGTAKPEADLLSRIPHHLINILNYNESFSAGEFVSRTDALIPQILHRGSLPVISGGSAFYIRSWLMGLPPTPPVNPAIRKKIEEQWRTRRDEEIHAALSEIDPKSALRISTKDRYRMLRALEVYSQTNRPLSDIQVPSQPHQDYRTLIIGLHRDRKELYQRINDRVDRMIDAGLEAEVAALRFQGARLEHPGMKGIGYREWFTQSSPQSIADLIARNTRRYAKRQITFFSSLEGVHWFDAAEPLEISGLRQTIADFLKGESNTLDQEAMGEDNPRMLVRMALAPTKAIEHEEIP